jgi:methylenetetrahydrofolate reductase (NADPH)
VVSPFKKLEAEMMTQFYKFEKKAKAGAHFFVPQLGYDMRKFAEIIRYMKERDIDVPILGNVYVVNKMVAGLMNKGHIPGCVVTDDLLAALGEEAKAEDKGKGARLERAAQMMAVFKGINFDGVHIGGFGLKAADFQHIIERSVEIGDNWRDHVQSFQYGQKDEFYLYPEDPELKFEEKTLVPVALKDKGGASPMYLANRIVHRLVFEPGSIGYGLCRILYKLCGKVRILGRISYFFERQIKRLLFDCQECGDCALFDIAYLCPMSKCAKSQRNGPCGGSRLGMCEADEEKKCVWVMAYRRLNSIGKLDQIRTNYVPPVDWALQKTSSWANFFMGRDHTAKKLKEQERKKAKENEAEA